MPKKPKPYAERLAKWHAKVAASVELNNARFGWVQLTKRTTLSGSDPADLAVSIPYPQPIRDAAARYVAAKAAWREHRRSLCPIPGAEVRSSMPAPRNPAPKPTADSRCAQCGRIAPTHPCRQCGDDVCNECSAGAGTMCFKCENHDADGDDDDTAC